MRPHLKFAQTANVVALGLWCGCILMTGAAAALTFPTLKKIAPSVPSFGAYSGEHWLLVGGKVVNNIFFALDIGQLAFGGLAIATLGIIVITSLPSKAPLAGGGEAAPGLSPWSRRHLTIRVLTLTLPVLLLLYSFFFLAPRMAANLGGFWEAAQRGDNAAAATLQAAFDADHPTASTLLSVSAGAVLLAAFAAAWPGRGEERAQ